MRALTQQDVFDAKLNQTPVLFEKAFPNVPTWDDFIAHINHAYQQPDEIWEPEADVKTIGYVRFWNRLTMAVDHADDWMPKYTDPINNWINAYHPMKRAATFSVIAFTNKDATSGYHFDPCDVFYWQCIGEVDWVFRELDMTIKLTPGDIVFVPAGVKHEVFSKTPRAAMSFGAQTNHNELDENKLWCRNDFARLIGSNEN